MSTLQRILFALAALLPAFAFADGFIIIPNGHTPVPGHFSFAPLEVSYHHVDVTIEDQVAVTKIDQEFYNPNPQRLEGTYIFPLPAGAHIDKFSMDIDGKMTDAELLSADKARSLYEEIVRKARDPALLEYVGRDAFKARIFPIEPNSRKRIKIQYTQLLTSDSNLVEYVYPLNTEKFSSRPLKDLSIKIDLRTKAAIKTLYCPSHNAEIRHDGAHRAVVGFEARDIRPDTDFKIVYSAGDKPVGIDLLTYRSPGDDGYFLLLASPGTDSPARTVQAKDICFVLDTSGSMAEGQVGHATKLDQARKALNFCLANLNEQDRFEIIRFSTEAEPLFNGLAPAKADQIDKARTFVNALKPMGGTALNDALQKALALRKKSDSKNPYLIIFLTDGQPTIGETNEDKIVANATHTENTRVFCFGIGADVNTHLLDRIAVDSKAFSQYVLPDEDLEIKVSNFYTKIKEPVLSNVEVAFTGSNIRVSQIYPNVMPDLFKGQSLIVFGRYTGKGPAAVTITGTLNNQPLKFVSDVAFTADDTRQTFIPRLWATRRVGWLLDEIRLRGESSELKDEVVRLAREHGIVTPYTAYLILEDERRRDVPVTLRNFRELEADRSVSHAAAESFGRNSASSPTMAKSGLSAVRDADNYNQLKYGWNEQQSAQGTALAKPSAPAGVGGKEASGYRLSQNYSQQARVINGRAFYQNGKTWTDSTAQSKRNLRQQTIQFNSDDYFALLRKYPTAAPWLSLGDDLDIVLDDTLYQIRG